MNLFCEICSFHCRMIGYLSFYNVHSECYRGKNSSEIFSAVFLIVWSIFSRHLCELLIFKKLIYVFVLMIFAPLQLCDGHVKVILTFYQVFLIIFVDLF